MKYLYLVSALLRAGCEAVSSVVKEHKPNTEVHCTDNRIFMLYRREIHLMSLFWLAFSLVSGMPILTSFFQAGSTIEEDLSASLPLGWACVWADAALSTPDHFTLASILLLLSLSPYSILGAYRAPISVTKI